MKKNEKIPVIAVVGPTASGKTALGVELSLRFGGEVVSADSMQIYSGMDIASAMPSAEEMRGVPHHLLGFLSPDERYSVAAYCEDAKKCIADIHSRGRLPFVVGGTGLYVNSLLDNIEFTPAQTDLELRSELNSRLEKEGIEPLLDELRRVDPESAARLHENDTKRIVRALEFFYQNGFTIAEQARLSRMNESPYEPLIIGLFVRDRQFLYDRINARVDRMAASGLLDEAKKCLESGRSTAAQAIGHKELAAYFSGNSTLDASLDRLRQQTRRYAKRQLTWFGRDERIKRLYIDDYADFDSLAEAASRLCSEFITSQGEKEHG